MTDSRSNAASTYAIEDGVPMPQAGAGRELQLVPAGAASTAVVQRVVGKPFAPGRSGNPAGRRPGSKNRISELFIAAMRDDFIEHGADAIAALRARDPATYLAAIRSMIPQNVMAAEGDKHPTFDHSELSDSEWADVIDADGNPNEKHMQQSRRNKAMHLLYDGKAASAREALAMLGADLD